MAQTQDDVKQRSNGSNTTSIDGVKVRSPKPNRRSSSLFNNEKHGRQVSDQTEVWIFTEKKQFQATESQNSYSGSWTNWEILYHQKILRKKICCEIFANSGNWLRRHPDICGQKRSINIDMIKTIETQIFLFCWSGFRSYFRHFRSFSVYRCEEWVLPWGPRTPDGDGRHKEGVIRGLVRLGSGDKAGGLDFRLPVLASTSLVNVFSWSEKDEVWTAPCVSWQPTSVTPARGRSPPPAGSAGLTDLLLSFQGGGRGGGQTVGGAARLHIFRDLGKQWPRSDGHVPGFLLPDSQTGGGRADNQNSQTGEETGRIVYIIWYNSAGPKFWIN